MLSVYDWVGSLALAPIGFELMLYNGTVIQPSQPVTIIAQQSLLYMRETEEPPNLDEDDPIVNFLGFGQQTVKISPTGSLLDITEVTAKLPAKLLESDEEDEVEE